MFTDWDDETTADSQDDHYADEPWDGEEQTVEQFFDSEQFRVWQREIDAACAARTQDTDPFEPWA